MKILAVTGSSGGHIFPALSFLEAASRNSINAKILLVIPKKNNVASLDLASGQVRFISAVALSFRPTLRNLGGFFLFFKTFIQSLFIIVEFRPDVVVGFGSFSSVPMVLLAWLFRIRTIIHEQNVLPGRANRFLAYFADKVAVSFPQTADYLKGYSDKIVLTGNPVSRRMKKIEKAQARAFLSLDNDKFTLLVMGGSSGSRKINEELCLALNMLEEKAYLQVIHLCGAGDYEEMKARYRDLKVKSKLSAFLEEMEYAYSSADLALCRGGAATISELIFFGLPAIIVPYPHAYAHQMDNAKAIEIIGSAVIIKDAELKADKLKELIGKFFSNRQDLARMRSNFDALAQNDASILLVKAVSSLVSI